MGGTRLMGEAAVLHLLDAGHHLTVFNRGSRSPQWYGRVDHIHGDRDVMADLRHVGDHDFDAVVDFSAYRGTQTAALATVLRPHTHLVHCSTGAVYAPVHRLPWEEGSPIGPWAIWGDYGREKLAAEEAALATADEGRPVTVFRLPYVLGPRNYAAREEFVLNRLLDKQAVAVPGDGKAVQHFVTAQQVGQSVANMVARSPGPGLEVFNIADPGLVCTTEGFVHLCAEVAGTEPLITFVPSPTPDTPFDPGNCVYPFPNEAYLLDVRRAAEAGLLPDPRSFSEAIGDALDVLRAEPERRVWSRTAAEEAALGTVNE